MSSKHRCSGIFETCIQAHFFFKFEIKSLKHWVILKQRAEELKMKRKDDFQAWSAIPRTQQKCNMLRSRLENPMTKACCTASIYSNKPCVSWWMKALNQYLSFKNFLTAINCAPEVKTQNLHVLRICVTILSCYKCYANI